MNLIMRLLSLSVVIPLTLFFAGLSGTLTVHASGPLMWVSPTSGPVNTPIKIYISGVPSATSIFIRFDGADFPEWQQTSGNESILTFSANIFPSSLTKGSQKISVTGGVHTIEAYVAGKSGRVASTQFTVIDSTNPPKLTVTPSSGPVGTKVEVRAVNVPPLTYPRLALKDGIEQVSYQEVKLQSDGSWTGTYTIPKEVVQGYEAATGKAVVIPVKAGEHSLMMYEKTEIVSAPFIVTEIKIAPTPTPTPNPISGDPIVTPTPAPTPTKETTICDPNIPSYSQSGCKPKETATTPIPAPSVSKTCDPNIPRYAQEGCSDSAISEKPAEKPTEQKPTCNPNVPSYNQIGCILAGTVQKKPEQSYTVIGGQAVLDEKQYSPATDSTPQSGRAGRGIVAGSIERGTQLEDIQKKTQLIKDNRYDDILAELKELRNTVKEQAVELKYLHGITKDMETLKAEVKNALTQFVTYGVDVNSQKLGAGERAAVLNSYKTAYSKLPDSDEEMSDMIKIVNGRFPSERNTEAESKAIRSFKQIYKRVPNLKNNQNDVAAIMVMAYGLRQAAENRNLSSEKKGIETFKSLFGKTPQTTDEWNVMQAITYSGAARRADRDKDLLSDDDEKLLGTDPTNSDTDKDGSIDGLEVENYSDPLNAAESAILDDAGWLLPKGEAVKDTNSGSTIEPSGARGRRYREDAG